MVWKKVQIEVNNKTKEKMKIVNVSAAKEEFIKVVKEEIMEFKDHIERAKSQYNHMKRLKEILPNNNVLVQMGFADNYKCQSQDEIQSPYWNTTQVTIHPAVVYYKDDDNLKHKSFVFVSDEPGHDASTVYAILKKLIPEIKIIIPDLKMVHYWSNSPTSQYRNKSIFNIVCNHKKWLPGGAAAWNYFEAGHGKGPCDWIGRTAKRLADDAIKQEKVIIQDAQDFFAWADQTQSSGKIKYLFVPTDECQESQQELAEKAEGLLRVPRTMKLHAVCAGGHQAVQVKDTLCYCLNCFIDGTFIWGCEGWKQCIIKKPRKNAELKEPTTLQSTPEENTAVGNNTHEVEVKEGEFVASVYIHDRKAYFAKVEVVDENDGDVFLSFMVPPVTDKVTSYCWPQQPDQVWVEKDCILCIVPEPMKLSRAFKVLPDTVETVQRLLEDWRK